MVMSPPWDWDEPDSQLTDMDFARYTGLRHHDPAQLFGVWKRPVPERTARKGL